MISDHQLKTFRDTVGEAFSAGMPQFPFYTLHGKNHLDELDRLCLLFGNAIPKLKQEKDKLNILRLAIIMHDYSMVDVPSPEREKELRDQMDQFLSFADIVRKTHQDEIVKSLGKKSQSLFDIFPNASIDEINDAVEIARYHRFHPLKDAPEHLKPYCSLMRLLDELDISSERAPRSAYSSLRERMDENARFHWLKHICCARIEPSRTFFHETVNGRHSIHLWVAVQATADSWRYLQQAIISKIRHCLDNEGACTIIRERVQPGTYLNTLNDAPMHYTSILLTEISIFHHRPLIFPNEKNRRNNKRN